MLLLHGGFLDTIANVLREVGGEQAHGYIRWWKEVTPVLMYSKQDATPPTSANLLYSDQSSRDKKYFHLDAKMPNTFKFTHYDNEVNILQHIDCRSNREFEFCYFAIFNLQNVRYDIRGWSQRNKSRLPGSVVVLLKNSENALLRLLIKGLDINF